MKPHTGFWFGVELRFSIDMVSLTGKCTRLFYQPAVERQLSEAISPQVKSYIHPNQNGCNVLFYYCLMHCFALLKKGKSNKKSKSGKKFRYLIITPFL
jgi:hypothetical protein